MLSASIMAVPSAAGHGTKDGTRKTQSGTRMNKAGRPRKWTHIDLNHVRALMEYRSASKVAEIMGTTKNAVIGALYRDKVRNGYVPPEDSKYTGQKNL